MTKSPPRKVRVYGAAKVNIGWRVGERRPDGYHDVRGMLHTISLTDRLDIETGVGDVPVRVVVPGHPGLQDDANIVHAAAALLAEKAEPRPTTIVVHKSIPVAAGLGGGSADAAAALVGLNAAWNARRSAKELVELAAEVGSDVPGIMLGGLVHVTGRGERVRNRGGGTDGWFVLGVSSIGVSAADAYEAFDRLSTEDAPATLHHNDLQAAACALVDGLEGRLDAMRRAAGVAFVAGSGPTVVGVTSDEAHARDVVARVRDTFADVIVAQPITWGVRLAVGGEGGA
ncbi:MAG TPA: 4-(cytidine 5'-diphospho)-2-C-methyl-D-erythritol kinase [Actinomycetota bacterium]|nr:4-(cytidine 5'-diphospho)-2-C-methyl-D-erythritol kinase [Actinomycetota bacterium]